MATVKKIKKAQNGIKKAQDAIDAVAGPYSASSDRTDKIKSADGNYKAKFEWKKGESKPSEITERRTLKGLLSGAKKARGKMTDTSQFKSGGAVKAKSGKQMIKRADGSTSQRGLWDNIRKNKGSGKKPTAQMLKQEKKIKAKTKK